MFDFIKKAVAVLCCALLVSIFLGGVVTLVTKDVYKDNYQKGFVYQYRRLQNADPETDKIIVIGGSYLTFSLNTKYMEELTGRPTYELGVQSNMGMCYNMELIADYINEGDIVVFPFEDFAADDYGMDLIYTSIESEPDMFIDFLKAHPQEMLTVLPRSIFRRVAGLLRNTEDPIYRASAFDSEYAYYNLDRPEQGMTEEQQAAAGYAYTMKDVDPTCIVKLNELNAICEEKGAKLYLTFAPIAELSVFTGQEGRDQYFTALDDGIDAPFICRLDDCFYQPSMIYNINMHLNNTGMKKYTEDLAEMVKPYINEQ